MDNSFVVSPMRQEVDLKPGEKYEGSILVTNPADATSDFAFTVKVNPYSVTGTDYQPDFVSMSDWSKMAEWITLKEDSGTLKPNESKRIYFSIDVPLDAPAGGQYAMIGVSSAPAIDGKKSEIQNIYQLASLVFAKIDGKTTHSGRVLDNYVPSFVASGVPTTVVTAVNDGNVHENLNMTLKVKNSLTGENISLSGESKDSYDSFIMPKSTRVVTRSLDGLPMLGIFDVTQDVSYLGDTSSTSVTMLLCPIWFMVLSIVTVVAIIVTICYLIFFKKKAKKLKTSSESQEY